MRVENKLMTSGYGFLTYERQREFQETLRRHKIPYRLIGKGADQEITLLKISVTGVIPTVITTILQTFGIELGIS